MAVVAQSLREHTFLGITQSLCPECLRVVPAKILHRGGRIYFRKRCPEHGSRDDFVCSDARYFDRLEFNVPGRRPQAFAIEPRLGCPYDCGLCVEHEQHTCVAVLELTDGCNLTCPVCYSASVPGGRHLPLPDAMRAIDHLVIAEGRPEVLQLSGGEPTIHPDFETILDYACERPIDIVMINTNGIRIAHDASFRELIARRKDRCQVYLQFDSLNESDYETLRGGGLLETKLRALEHLGEMGVYTTLVSTLGSQTQLSQVAALADFGVQRRWIAGISYQPATHVGRYLPALDLENRVTFPDVIRSLSAESGGTWRETDFLPLPCAHPNTHSLAYAYRYEHGAVPLSRFMDIGSHLDLLANGIGFTRESAKELIQTFLARQTCGEDCGCGPALVTLDPGPSHSTPGPSHLDSRQTHRVKLAAERFFRAALEKRLSSSDVFRITTTSFMDAYNFDLRQLMKSCVHHVLPSGHIIPFCAYNNLYRNGVVKLPALP